MGLTYKQRLFCNYYVKSFNATKAYKKAYGCSYKMANSNASRMMLNDGIKQEIDRLQNEKIKNLMLNESDIFDMHMKIAFSSDVTDYVQFGTDKEGNNYINLIEHKECIDTNLIKELEVSKNGVKIQLHDKLKSLDWLYNKIQQDNISKKEKEKEKQDDEYFQLFLKAIK